MNDRTLADIFVALVPHIPQVSQKDRTVQKCVPLTHVHTFSFLFFCITEFLIWKKGCWSVKTVSRGAGSEEQAGGFIRDKQEGTWNLHQC